GWRAAGQPGGSIAGEHLELRGDGAHAAVTRFRPRRRSGCLFALLHHHPASGAGDRQPHSARPHRAPAVAAGGAIDLSLETAAAIAAAAAADEVAPSWGSPPGLRPTPSSAFVSRFESGSAKSRTGGSGADEGVRPTRQLLHS